MHTLHQSAVLSIVQSTVDEDSGRLEVKDEGYIKNEMHFTIDTHKILQNFVILRNWMTS